MSSKPIAEGVKLQGILADGYGIMPQAVSRNKKLTPEAKAIYAYLTSFSGASFKPIFPSRELMLEELNMSINRFYKHMQLLLDLNLVAIERSVEGNIFGKNIYSLVLVPEIEKETVRVKKPARISKRLDGLKIEQKPVENTQREEQIVAAAPDCKDGEGHIEAAKIELQQRGSAGNDLDEQLGIQELITKNPKNKELIESILLVIEDMAASEQITINGSVKKKAAIKQLIKSLKPEHIEMLVSNISGSGQKIRKKKAYIQSCIGNILFDIKAPLDFSKKQQRINQDENIEAQSELVNSKELYLKYPELKELDDQIYGLGSKISKAILSGNEVKTKSLKDEKENLEKQREKMILKIKEPS